MRNPDGTGACDRCGGLLPSDGVIYGMVTSDLTGDGGIVNRLYCYVNECATYATTGLTVYAESTSPRCSRCGLALAEASPMTAVVAAILASDGHQMPLLFCRTNGCADQFRAQASPVVVA